MQCALWDHAFFKLTYDDANCFSIDTSVLAYSQIVESVIFSLSPDFYLQTKFNW